MKKHSKIEFVEYDDENPEHSLTGSNKNLPQNFEERLSIFEDLFKKRYTFNGFDFRFQLK